MFSGLSADFIENTTKWKFLYEAKEPDNLPFHEPWQTKLNRFQKLVLLWSRMIVLQVFRNIILFNGIFMLFKHVTQK